MNEKMDCTLSEKQLANAKLLVAHMQTGYDLRFSGVLPSITFHVGRHEWQVDMTTLTIWRDKYRGLSAFLDYDKFDCQTPFMVGAEIPGARTRSEHMLVDIWQVVPVREFLETKLGLEI